MQLTAFRVENYRSVLDSGWVRLEDITVIVGKNESGKTSLLKALWKFNAYKDECYDLLREWPRGRRREMADTQNVITVHFDFTPEERAQLQEIEPAFAEVTGAHVSRNYRGDYSYQFLPKNPETHHNLKWVFNVIRKHFSQANGLGFEQVKAGYKGVLDAVMQQEVADSSEHYTISHALAAGDRPRSYPTFRPQGKEQVAIAEALEVNIQRAISELTTKLPIRQAVERVHSWLPTFIYMDDYKVFSGSAQLDQVKQRRVQGRLTDEDRTIMMIMEMAGLGLEDEVRKGNLPDKEQRMLDMNDASQTLTEEIAHRWSQKKYEVLFQADGQHFITFVKDAATNILVPLEERSKGFQWFFSFDMTFMYETQGQFANAVILLDEPGLHLHAAAQRDLLLRMRAYAQRNQLIYTTHLPFMVDFNELENIRICEERGKSGTQIAEHWHEAGKDARFTLQAALGLSWSDSLLTDTYNLLVEDVADFWLLSALSTLLAEAGRTALDDDLTVTPAGGATRIAYVGTLLQGEQRKVAVLFNGREESRSAHEELAQGWLTQEGALLQLDALLDFPRPHTLEDLFPESYYLAQVNAAYHDTLHGWTLRLDPDRTRPVLERVVDALRAQGVETFHRERVARQMLRDLGAGKTEPLAPDTLDRAELLVTTLNGIVKRWKTLN